MFAQNVFGQGINFQGVARSANGTILASQKISLKLSIITGVSTNTPDYIETRSISTNAQGIFSIVVGDTGAISTIGVYSNINWKANIKFLKVEMDPNNGTNFISMGTTPLQYVPFSYYSNGVDASNIAGVLPVKSGGTGVTSLDELKGNLKIPTTDTSFLSNRIDSKLSKIDTISLSNRIDKKLDANSPGLIPNGVKVGTVAVWNGKQWVSDDLLLNNSKRISIGKTEISDSSAILDINSTNAGLLIPRLSETQRDNIKNPSEGLMIYCLDYYGIGNGGALQIRTAGKWITLFSYNLNNANQDCPYLYDIQINGTPIIDSSLTISYAYDSSSGSSIRQEPLIFWARGRYQKDANNISYLVYDIIQGENSKQYKVKSDDIYGLKAILIPRNKPGAICLVGDSVFQKIGIVNYYNIDFNTPVSTWQNVIDSLYYAFNQNKAVFDLLTDNLKTRSSYTETFRSTDGIWNNYYLRIKKATFYINKFSGTIPDQYKDVYGQLLAFRSIIYFYALRTYSYGVETGIPIIDNQSIGDNGNLTRSNKSNVLEYIIRDLKSAETYLDSFSDNKKISKQLSTAFLAKVLLFKGDYTSTVTQCLKFLNNYNQSNNTLVNTTNYYTLYNDTTTFNTSNEILFQNSLKNSFLNTGYYTNSNSELADQPRGSGAYELTSEGYSLFNAIGTSDIRRFFISLNTTSNVNFFNKYLYIRDGNYGRYYQSYSKVLTMSEFYLIYAEALARTSNIPIANTFLNKVATARDQTITPFNLTNSADLLNQILIEKRKELFAEGEYFFDYIRIKGFSTLNYYAYYYANMKENPSQFKYGLPIPSSVITINPGITQNPGF